MRSAPRHRLGGQEPADAARRRRSRVTGTKGFKGTYTIDRFASRGGKLVAVGTLKGTMRKNGETPRVTPQERRDARRRDRRRPGRRKASQVPPIPGACQVLNLVLGPINLNLLGLVVRTNQINVR